MIPYSVLWYVGLRMLFDPRTHQRDRPISASLINFFDEVIKDARVPFWVPFRPPSFVGFQSGDTALIVLPDPGTDTGA